MKKHTACIDGFGDDGQSRPKIFKETVHGVEF